MFQPSESSLEILVLGFDLVEGTLEIVTFDSMFGFVVDEVIGELFETVPLFDIDGPIGSHFVSTVCANDPPCSPSETEQSTKSDPSNHFITNGSTSICFANVIRTCHMCPPFAVVLPPTLRALSFGLYPFAHVLWYVHNIQVKRRLPF